MRTKLFFAFFLVIFTALVSDFIFERLIMKDFDEYIKGTKEDRLYWVVAAVESAYHDGKWNMKSLADSIHWGMMEGFDLRVTNGEGKEIIDSNAVMNSLSPAMKRKMQSLIHLHTAEGEFERYPLYAEGRELGTLLIRPLKSGGVTKEKEMTFKKRGRNFLMMSFFIAGAWAVAMAVFFSLYLSKPLRRLKLAAGKVATGDFSIRVKVSSRDEIGKLAESFNYMAEALQKEDSLRKHLTSNIAHELRTPLAVMKAHVEAMIDGVVEDTGEGLDNIRGEVERLTRLVEGIEDITKAEAGFFSPGEYKGINLKDFLQGIRFAMEPLFLEKRLVVSVTDRGDVDVVTDVEKLEIVVRNILTNSLKYTEGGGAWIDYGKKGTGFFIEVRDTGIGIPEDEKAKIFTRFYRGRDASDRGIGIGLAIVKELVDIMSGKIEVESKVGGGTTFRIWLPVKTA